MRWIFAALAGMMIFISVMFIRLLSESGFQEEKKNFIEQPKYHFQVLIQNKDEYFGNLFQQGAIAASEELGVFTEFIQVSSGDIDSLENAVELALFAGIDGIALKAVDSIQSQGIIEKVKKNKTEIVVYENDNFTISNTTMIGSNNYAIGSMVGNMAVKAAEDSANVAIILGNSEIKGEEQYKNLIVQGIMDSFSKYPSIKITDIYSINPELFETEKVALSAIASNNKTSLIICVDERSTPGVAQVLVDNNKVGDIQLIGYGAMPQTLDYIRRGVVYGTICPDAYDIGYYTIQKLMQEIEGENSSDFINTDLYSIDLSNFELYLKGLE